MRIIFIGTPEFAVPTLEMLVESGKDVVAVITTPDKKAGRGSKLHKSAIKTYVEELDKDIPLLQPPNLKDPDFIEELKSYKADLQICVAFRMLPEIVWNMPKHGTLNLHGSLLPQYRGSAPLNWAIMNGETKTGITTFFLKHEIDTGDILLQETHPIKNTDTVGDLYYSLMNKGADLVLKSVETIEKGNYTLLPQNINQELKEAPKIYRETCEIDWTKPSIDIYNQIRGLSPYPCAWTKFNGKFFKIFKATVMDGIIIKNDYEIQGSNLLFKTGTGCISVEKVQIEGKKQMDIISFLNGIKSY